MVHLWVNAIRTGYPVLPSPGFMMLGISGSIPIGLAQHFSLVN